MNFRTSICALILFTLFSTTSVAIAQEDDLVVVSYKDVMTPSEAVSAGYFEHNGRWLKKKWKRKVKKWKRLDRSHSEWEDAQRFATKHYRVISNLGNHIMDSEVAPFLDAQYKAYTRHFKREFGLSAKAANKKLIKIHKSIEDYAANTQKSVQQARYNPGFITGGSVLTVYYDERDPDVFFGTVMHEGAHQFVLAIFPGANFPKWIHEGLATYFEGCSYSRATKTFTLGDLPMARLNTARRALLENPGASMGELFMNVPDVKFGARQYALAWSFLHFLVHGQKGKYKKHFVNFLKKMNGAGVKNTPAQIFKKISRVDFTDLEDAWKAHVTGLQTTDIPWWVVLRGQAEELERYGIRPQDRVTHVNGVRVINERHFTELWEERQPDAPTNLIVRGSAREDGGLRGVRIPAGVSLRLRGTNSVSRHGSLTD